MSHYYTDNTDLESNREVFKYYFRDQQFNFTTDIGVFSKKDVDFGSYVLINTVIDKELGPKLLDLGCGYGPIGIIIKRFNPNIELDMVDINSRATELSIVNLSNNFIEANVYCNDNIETLNKSYNTILLNPPIRTGKKNIFDLYEKSYRCLESNGKLYIVIQKKQGEESSFNKLKDLFDDVSVINKQHGYYVIEAMKK